MQRHPFFDSFAGFRFCGMIQIFAEQHHLVDHTSAFYPKTIGLATEKSLVNAQCKGRRCADSYQYLLPIQIC
ncbi:hypothetical protein KYX90_13790, partial [Enterococcus lactis]|uniref:hypothetical protein n=1 Tax=Enterococcus lactis TaxID=357441 RepID=UPI001C7D25E2